MSHQKRPVQLNLVVAPCFASNIVEGVKQQLDNRLLTSWKELDGAFAISYEQIKFPSKYAKIVNECPFMHVKVLVKVLCFNPQKGQQMSGVVTRQSENHISLTVYDHFSANIRYNDIVNGTFDEEQEAWTVNGQVIQQGDSLSFQVKEVYVEDGMLSIQGELQ